VSWWQQVPHFIDRYQVITLDQRCFGRSRCPVESFHPKYFADDALAVLDAVGARRAAFVCQSMGGWTGLHTALHSPGRVSCLVLGGTPGGIFSERIIEAASRVAASATAEGISGNAALAPDFPKRQPALAWLYDQIAALNTGFEPHLLARMYDEDGRILPEQLGDFRVPTLILAGEYDQLFAPDVLHHVAGLIPGAEVRDFPGVGHSTYFEAPETFNRVVDEFVRQHHGP
jgi:pimeloyl-ACP methyl ester carboxylesterase